MVKSSLYNISLRGITLLSKFILLFYMAKYFPAQELGIYGLITVTINFLIFFLGMDFYVYNTREILSETHEKRGKLVRDQLILHILIYIILFPFIYILFFVNLLPRNIIFIFYSLLILEHLSQESYRLLNTLSKPKLANVVLFFRSGSWVYPIIIVSFFFPIFRNIVYILYFWLIGLILSIVISVQSLNEIKFKKYLFYSINWKWIKKGILISMPFLMATLSLQIIQYLDRFFIKYYHGDSMVGVYTFYINISNVIQTFISTGVFVLLYPKIISSYQSGETEEFKLLMKKLTISATIGVTVISVLAAIGINPLLFIINKSIYSNYLKTYYILLLSVIMNVFSQISHYYLYARGKDKLILYSTIPATSISVILNLIFIPKYGIYGASISNLISMCVLFLMKTISAVYSSKCN